LGELDGFEGLEMLKEMPTPTAEQLAAAEKCEAEAKASSEKSRESFERCDTDGFLSQWAHDMQHDLKMAEARLLRNGGHALFPVLCDADGNVVATKVYEFPDRNRSWITVRRWRLPNELAEKAGRKWLPFGLNSRVQKKLGYHEEDRWFPAYVKLTTGGRKSTGFAGCANAFVGTF
jgi:hypothetical protein